MHICLEMSERREVTLCNHNFSMEGILHPNRIMDEYDLLYMQDGEWEIIEDDIVYHLSSGSVLLLEPGKHHYSIKKCSPMMRNIYIHFKNNSYDKTVISPDETILLHDKSNRVHVEDLEQRPTDGSFADTQLNVPKIIETSDYPEIRHGFERVVDAFWSTNENTRHLRSSLYLENLLIQLSDLYMRNRENSDILISEIIHRFHCEPEHFISPEELADTYHISVRSISGRFKKATGFSIHQYQIKIKLLMAYDMLPLSPERSLHSIALSYGFYDEFQFSKLFKRQFGITPSQRR